MANKLFSVISKTINSLLDLITQGSFERLRVTKELNIAFKEAFLSGEIDRHCTVSICAGNSSFRHEMSSFPLRSGFKVNIENDDNLKESDFIEISKYILSNPTFVRQLMVLGFDTLAIKGKNQLNKLEIPLKEHGNLKDFMLGN